MLMIPIFPFLSCPPSIINQVCNETNRNIPDWYAAKDFQKLNISK